MDGVASPTSSPRLRRIIFAYTVNRIGSWIGLVALSLAVFDHTHSALAVAALLFAWQALPAFLVPALVARVEVSTRRHELSGLYFFEALATAAIAVLLGDFWLPGLLLLAALDGTAALAASSLLRAEVARAARDHVEAQPDAAVMSAEQLEHETQAAERVANGALTFSLSAATIGGPVAGSLIVAAVGAPAALLTDVASFLICGALLLDLYPHVKEGATDSVRARLNAAWSHIQETRLLRGLLLTEAATLIFIQAAGPIEVAYAKATLHSGDRGYGLLVTCWGTGAAVASVAFSRLARRSLGTMLSAGVFALGAAYVGMSVAPSLATACAAAFVGGLGNGFEWPSLISLVQQLSPPRLHGRLMGAVESLAALCLAVGLPLGGLLVAVSSTRSAFLIIGLAAMLTTPVFVRLSFTGRTPRGASVAPLVMGERDDRSGSLPGTTATTVPPPE